MTDADIAMLVSRKERAIHCRRKTRGVDATTRIIDELIESLDSDAEKDVTDSSAVPVTTGSSLSSWMFQADCHDTAGP